MKLTVFGANGGTGVEILRRALVAGHTVTAVLRDGAGLPADLAERIDVTHADVLDSGAIERLVTGRDAVLSVIGARDMRAPTSVCSDSVGSIIAAMRAGGGGRLVTASNTAMAAGPGDDPVTRYLVKPVILQRLLKHALADMAEAEQRVRACGLDWTIVRAGRLTDGRSKNGYRSAVDRNVLGGIQITRSDLAAAMLDIAGDPTTGRHIVSVGN